MAEVAEAAVAVAEDAALNALISLRWPLKKDEWAEKDVLDIREKLRDLVLAKRCALPAERSARAALAPLYLFAELVRTQFDHNFGKASAKWTTRPSWPFRYLERLLDAFLDAADSVMPAVLGGLPEPLDDATLLRQTVAEEVSRIANGYAIAALQKAHHNVSLTCKAVNAIIDFDAKLDERQLTPVLVRRPVETLAATQFRLDAWIKIDKAVVRDAFHEARATMGSWEVAYNALIERLESSRQLRAENDLLPPFPSMAATFAHLWDSSTARFNRVGSPVKRMRFVDEILKPLLNTCRQAALKTAQAYMTGKTWLALQQDLASTVPLDESVSGSEVAKTQSVFGRTERLADLTGLGACGYSDVRTAQLLHTYGIVNLLCWVEKVLHATTRDPSFVSLQAASGGSSAVEQWDTVDREEEELLKATQDESITGMMHSVIKSLEANADGRGSIFRKEEEGYRGAANAILKDVKATIRDDIQIHLVRYQRLLSRIEGAGEVPCRNLLVRALDAVRGHASAIRILNTSLASTFLEQLQSMVQALARDIDDPEWKEAAREALAE
eukprot:scaffold1941_cov263-Pinguiococcus_pyrenoidosus.AAC.1